MEMYVCACVTFVSRIAVIKQLNAVELVCQAIMQLVVVMSVRDESQESERK